MKRSISLLALLLAAAMAVAKRPPQPLTRLTVATWNIGHFALGTDKDTHVLPAEAADRSLAYRQLLNDVGADVLAVCEYEPNFVNPTDTSAALPARDAIASGYAQAAVGPKYDYNCNAVFANGATLADTAVVAFKQMVQTRYYLCVTLDVGGRTVKVVSTHLDWNQGANGAACRAAQIREIIDAFKTEKYVILCADWNVRSGAEYDAFLDAGFSMANHGALGDILTCPAGTVRRPLDNIITRGFAISRVRTHDRPDLSDHCLLQADLTLLP